MTDTLTEKKCTKCKLVKSIEDFSKRYDYLHRNSSWCKACTTEYGKVYYQKDKLKHQLNFRRRQLAKFGLTEEDYNNLLNTQEGVCAICGATPNKKGGLEGLP